ncbi:endonuclease/exonuclease/phosphatase family protein [Photobacterium sanctipauli]|uniref:Endonuclease/exonuclease/phosphatase family protein n=1 Tax=Photobacterium sanctipauli TaxID=1342794 RepID=A0A2T3P157_9GAMM|nr:endonuclease/exonuclease/phosphatase family protein [Photobacterium sanctipauli]PSW22255.1 endonuclease/exonuclease/phosphatase family protein [Photobacterium sanctipauli]
MKLLKSSLALLVGTALITGCNDETIKYVEPTERVKLATFNLSFDRATFEELADEMQVSPEKQSELVIAYLDNSIDEQDKVLAEHIIQIRNVAAIVQKNRPHVLMMAEFNNDGVGEDLTALQGFQINYLSVPQSIDGAGGEPNLEPIEYPFLESYATNTGLVSGYDLDNDGSDGTAPGDSWGFGNYHGQYAFALMSQYEIDTANTRTFQEFKWKDLEGAKNPTITICDGSEAIPDGMQCGDEWYSDEEWEVVRLSSKNHVDAPIIVPTESGEETVHLLMSHPTPPVFDPGKNMQMNAAEVEFWQHYINGSDSIYDDNGTSGGLGEEAKFVIMGDLNLERWSGDGITDVMEALHSDPLVNQSVANGALYPVSYGAAEHAVDESIEHPYPNRITSTFGLGVDYAMPSATLDVKATGVYWSASYEEGRKLFNDQDVGFGDGKSISSDHRMVWIEAQL